MSSDSMGLIRNIPVFGGLSNAALEHIFEQSETISVTSGNYFFHEGEAAKSLFVLKEGSVVIEKLRKGEAIELGKLQRGDCLGEMSLIDMQPRSASVRAVEECLALEISIPSLHRLYKIDLEQYTLIMMNMGREVSRRLRKADERLFNLECRLSD